MEEKIDHIHSKQDYLMISLTKFFKNKNNYQIFIDIYDGNSKISLRIIDWFVTNYCKKNDINWKCGDKTLLVHKEYKDQLKAFTKKQFDPFCRRERIVFYYDETKSIRTTVGQLNFFRWAIENNIIDYIKNNYDDIERDMVSNTKTLKKKQKDDLVITANKSINKYNVEIVLEFD